MSLRVAVLAGGMSAEREVSLRTGRAVSSALEELGHVVVAIDPGRDLAVRLEQVAPDVAFIALHGRGGEDGTVQGLLEMMGIPYTGSGVLASAISMDKVLAKRLLRHQGIPVAEDVIVVRGCDTGNAQARTEAVLAYPVIVKPACEGSSIGITRVEHRKDLAPALDEVFRMDDRAIVERFVPGRLLTVGIIGIEPLVLPVLEVKTGEGFYDYQAKYQPGFSEYEVPADLAAGTASAVVDFAIEAFRALRCESLARVDMILDEATGKPVVLEINTVPGMTKTSLLPKAAAAAGLTFSRMVEKILEGARLKVDLGG